MAAALPERERWTPLISEVLKTDDGVVVDATECGRGAECGELAVDAPDLIRAIEEILGIYNTSENADLRIVIGAGIASIVGSQDYESVNAAQRALREVLTATCSDLLRSSDLSALIYAEDSLDKDHRKAVWHLLMRLPLLLKLPASATVAIVAGDGVVDYDVHCSGDPSLRDRLVDGGGLLSRHPWEISRRPVLALRSHDRTRLPYFVLFLGAGASVADGLPTGDALRNQALGKALGRDVDRATFEEAARDWWGLLESAGDLSEVELGEGIDVFVRDLTLERVIANEQRLENQNFSSTLQDFSEAHRAVVAKLREQRLAGALNDDPFRRMIATQQRLILVTVNFDQLIEVRADDGQIKTFITEEDLAGFNDYLLEYGQNGGAVPLLKLHGDIGQPETIVANIEQTRAGLSSARDAALDSLVKLIEQQPQRPWWYVGYSMRDRDLANTWNSSRMADFNEYWVSPFMDVTVRRFIQEHRSRNWETKGRGVDPARRHISLTASDFYGVMADDLTAGWT